MIIVDIETTGLDEKKNSIVSIGAIDFFNPERTFYAECKAEEGTEIDPIALEVNGFTITEVIDSSKSRVYEIVRDLMIFVENTEGTPIIIGQNVQFDYKFIDFICKKYDIENKFGRRLMDMHSCFQLMHLKKYNKFYEGKASLDTELGFFEQLPEARPHNALTGCRAIYIVLNEILKNL